MSTEELSPAQLQITSSKPLKVFSCVLCAQRKVKCDRKQPCSNCIKSGVTCTPGAPPKPRSRRRRVIETDVAARLQRYEELLHRHGIKFDELDEPSISGSSDVANTNIGGDYTHSYRPDIAGKDGVPLYPHNNLWSPLSDEILDASSDDERDLSLRLANQSLDSEPSSPPKIELELFDLDTPLPDTLHPQPLQIFQLWQTFLDNFHPLTKIIHAPSIQQEISRAGGSPQNFSKPMQALMFSIYSCSLASMRDEDCMEILGEDRTLAHRRFAGIAKKALTVAGLLTTQDMMVLQAFVLFLLSIRNVYDTQALWILTGVAVRLTERIGLYREPFLESLSVFDAEYARRIVWQVAILDGHTAARARVDTPPRIFYRREAMFPLNVNDTDLDINMRERPQEHPGVTEMVFCLIRCEFGNQLHNQAATEGNSMMRLLGNPSTPVSEKETSISKLENIFEEKFVKHCDPAIPLQLLSMVMVKVMFGRLRLAARHPRRFRDRGATMSQEEKDSLFAICLMMIDYDNQGHRLSGMHRFMWHVKANFQLDAFVYILNELRHNSVGDRADYAWREILECFEHHSDVLTDTKNPLHVAIGNLALKSWGARESMLAHLGQTLADGEIPRPISVLRSQRSVVVSPGTYSNISDQGVAGEAAQNQAFKSAYPTHVDSIDSAPIDWEYWNDLINASGMMMDDTQYQQPAYDARL
ncbi:hypothetical protein V496_02853 [Pseudogymnoascus sp. VKM F-4515 (FW-2607)]|nr:hypothetical protein V496_02853 [Pseudogymnoascus sp. VKM F-4515 (FW-2607)]